MKSAIKYQADDNAAGIRLSGGDILESFEVAPNVIFDYGVDGRIVRIELLNARAPLSAELLSDAAWIFACETVRALRKDIIAWPTYRS